MDLVIQEQAAPALAAGGFTRAELFYWHQGEFEKSAGFTSSSAYGDAFIKTPYARAEVAGLIDREYTTTVVGDLGDSYGNWNGNYEAYRALPKPRAYFVPTYQLPEASGHFLGDSQAIIGRAVSSAYQFGAPSNSPAQRGGISDSSQLKLTSPTTGVFAVLDGRAALVYGAAGVGATWSGVIEFTAREAAGVKWNASAWRFHYVTDGTGTFVAKGATLLYQEGEAGFTASITDFVGISGNVTVTPPTGAWTINATVRRNTSFLVGT